MRKNSKEVYHAERQERREYYKDLIKSNSIGTRTRNPQAKSGDNYYPPINTNFSKSKDFWSSDFNHFTDEQAIRQKRAREYYYLIVKIDEEYRTGIFKSSEENKNYNTSLNSCNCNDFKERKKPCKHMYCLAGKLGLIDLYSEKLRFALYRHYYCNNYNKKRMEEFLNKFSSIETKNLIQKLVQEYPDTPDINGNNKFIIMKNDKLQELINYKIIKKDTTKNISNDEYCFRFSSDFLREKNNLNYYFMEIGKAKDRRGIR